MPSANANKATQAFAAVMTKMAPLEKRLELTIPDMLDQHFTAQVEFIVPTMIKLKREIMLSLRENPIFLKPKPIEIPFEEERETFLVERDQKYERNQNRLKSLVHSLPGTLTEERVSMATQAVRDSADQLVSHYKRHYHEMLNNLVMLGAQRERRKKVAKQQLAEKFELHTRQLCHSLSGQLISRIDSTWKQIIEQVYADFHQKNLEVFMLKEKFLKLKRHIEDVRRSYVSDDEVESALLYTRQQITDMQHELGVQVDRMKLVNKRNSELFVKLHQTVCSDNAHLALMQHGKLVSKASEGHEAEILQSLDEKRDVMLGKVTKYRERIQAHLDSLALAAKISEPLHF